jgi:hypothetical protein
MARRWNPSKQVSIRPQWRRRNGLGCPPGGSPELAGTDSAPVAFMSYDSSTGLLKMRNGTSVVDLHFFGSYSQGNFKFASNGHGGTIVYDPPVAPSGPKDTTVDNGGSSAVSQLAAHAENKGSAFADSSAASIAGNSTGNPAGEEHEKFLFKPNFGQAMAKHLAPGIETREAAVSQSADSLTAAIHENLRGITNVVHDIIAVESARLA